MRAKKVLIPHPTVQSIIKKLKQTKCILNLSGRERKRKTTASVDRIIQRKRKLNRRKSAPTVKAEIEKELGVIVHANKGCGRINGGLVFSRHLSYF